MLHEMRSKTYDNTTHDLDKEIDLGRDLEVLAKLQVSEKCNALHCGLTSIPGRHITQGDRGKKFNFDLQSSIHVGYRVSWSHLKERVWAEREWVSVWVTYIRSNHGVEAIKLSTKLRVPQDGRSCAVCNGEETREEQNLWICETRLVVWTWSMLGTYNGKLPPGKVGFSCVICRLGHGVGNGKQRKEPIFGNFLISNNKSYQLL